MSKKQNLMTRQEKIKFIQDYQKGKALPPITGVVFINEGKVFGYQTLHERKFFTAEEEIPLDEFRKSGNPFTHQVQFTTTPKSKT